MMNYKKGRNVEVEIQRGDIPIPSLPEKFLWMHVSAHRIRQTQFQCSNSFHAGQRRYKGVECHGPRN